MRRVLRLGRGYLRGIARLTPRGATAMALADLALIGSRRGAAGSARRRHDEPARPSRMVSPGYQRKPVGTLRRAGRRSDPASARWLPADPGWRRNTAAANRRGRASKFFNPRPWTGWQSVSMRLPCAMAVSAVSGATSGRRRSARRASRSPATTSPTSGSPTPPSSTRSLSASRASTAERSAELRALTAHPSKVRTKRAAVQPGTFGPSANLFEETKPQKPNRVHSPRWCDEASSPLTEA